MTCAHRMCSPRSTPQTPYGKQYGDEYDFPSRGFADGQPEFQVPLTLRHMALQLWHPISIHKHASARPKCLVSLPPRAARPRPEFHRQLLPIVVALPPCIASTSCSVGIAEGAGAAGVLAASSVRGGPASLTSECWANQECLTRGLSEAPYEATVARGQTRREAQVLLSRLNGICEASLKVDRSKNYMPPMQQSSDYTPGSRVHSTYGRPDADGCDATVVARGEGGSSSSSSSPKSSSAAGRYTMVYDDGLVVEAVPRNSMRPLTRRPPPPPAAPATAGRQLAAALGRLGTLSADDGPSDPAALTRAFKSFLRKGEDAVPIRYEMTEDPANIVRSSSAHACLLVPGRVWACLGDSS